MFGALVRDIAVRTEGRGFDYRAGQIDHSVATAAMFFHSSVALSAQTQNRGDGSRSLWCNTAIVMKIFHFSELLPHFFRPTHVTKRS